MAKSWRKKRKENISRRHVISGEDTAPFLSRRCKIKKIASKIASNGTEGSGKLKSYYFSHFHSLKQEQSPSLHHYAATHAKPRKVLLGLISDSELMVFSRQYVKLLAGCQFLAVPSNMSQGPCHFILLGSKQVIWNSRRNTYFSVMAATFPSTKIAARSGVPNLSNKTKLYVVFKVTLKRPWRQNTN